MFLNLNMWNNSIFINVHGFIILFWCNLFTMLREAMCFSCLWLNRDSGWNYYSLIIHCTVWWGATGCIPRTVMLQWASLFAMILMIYNTCANLSFIGFLFLYFWGQDSDKHFYLVSWKHNNMLYLKKIYYCIHNYIL